MSDALTTLVTAEMRALVGTWMPARTAPPICSSDIRRWAIATYWPEQPPPLYWDEAHAATTRWGGIIAPADFNPFAWPVPDDRPPTLFLAGPRGVRLSPMNGGQSDRFGVPMRIGDIITERRRVTEISERPGRMGLTLYFITEIEWTNQIGEFIRQRLSRGIRYAHPGVAE